MKKIGVVSKVEYDGPGTKSIYIGSEEENLIYISSLFITIYNENKKIIQKIKIGTWSSNYTSQKKNLLYLGDIVEYDIESDSVIKLVNFTEDNLKEIELIQRKYEDRIGILEEKDFISALAKCSNIEEVKQIAWFLKRTSKFEQHMDKVRTKNILEGMSRNLKLFLNIFKKTIENSLNNEDFKEILIRLDTSIKLLYDILHDNISLYESNPDEYNDNLVKLLNSYWLYNFYEAIAKSRNIDNISNLMDLKKVKRFLIEKEMLPIKIKVNNKRR